MRGLWVACVAIATACGGAAPSADPPAPERVVQPRPIAAATPVEQPTPPAPPSGYVEMTAASVTAAGDTAQAVWLVDPGGTVVLPILIGGTEAMTIAFRLYKQPFGRPLTHDLMDSMLRKLDAEIYKVQVDDLVDAVFVGSVYIHRGAKVWQLDARPSDAIAIAIGHSAPIYVARKVLDAAAKSGVLGGDAEDKVTPKPTPK